MPNDTKLMNLKYANIGDVKITFDDNTQVTQNIDSIISGDSSDSSVGLYFDQNSSRNPVTVEALDGKWNISDLPVNINYPDGENGAISVGGPGDNAFYHHWVLYFDETSG